MYVKIGPYKNWFGPFQLAEKILFWKDKEDDAVYDLGEKISETFIDDFLFWIDSKKKRTKKVRIDKFDTWSMDRTLAVIILPMLKQLKATNHGAPFVDDKDVPKHLKSTSAPELTREEKDCGATDAFHFERWNWVMDEMIWAFEQIVNDSKEHLYFEDGTLDVEGCKAYNKRIDNGTRLFGVYFRGLWD